MKKVICTVFVLFFVAYVCLIVKNNLESNNLITSRELTNDYNPANTEKYVKVNVKSNDLTYAQIENKQYKIVDINPDVIYQANKFNRNVKRGIDAGIIKIKNTPTKEDLERAEEALVVYGYTYPDFQIPMLYCNKYYKIPNYRKAFVKRFGKENGKARNILVEFFGESGFEYLFKELSVFQKGAVLTEGFELMDENYEDFKVEVAKYGLKNPTRAMFCRFINDMPETVLDQQFEVFRIQHPKF